MATDEYLQCRAESLEIKTELKTSRDSQEDATGNAIKFDDKETEKNLAKSNKSDRLRGKDILKKQTRIEEYKIIGEDAKEYVKHVKIGENEVKIEKLKSDKKEITSEELPGDLYIRFVIRQEGRTDLVWLFKTHKF